MRDIFNILMKMEIKINIKIILQKMAIKLKLDFTSTIDLQNDIKYSILKKENNQQLGSIDIKYDNVPELSF